MAGEEASWEGAGATEVRDTTSMSPMAAVRCVERDGCNESTRLVVWLCFSGLEIQDDKPWFQQDGSQQTARQRLIKV